MEPPLEELPRDGLELDGLEPESELEELPLDELEPGSELGLDEVLLLVKLIEELFPSLVALSESVFMFVA
jgi:hypothetical protein